MSEADASLLEQAWALKEDTYHAMYAEPSRAESATARLAAWREEATSAGARAEIEALRAWLVGAAALLRGEPAAAITSLDEARVRFSERGRHDAEAACQVPKIAALAMLGRHAEALECAEATRALLLAAGDERGAGKVELNLGSMLLRQHRYADAERRYRGAAARFARVDDRQHSVMADIGLADALAWQHDFDEAGRIHARAWARAQAHGLSGLCPLIDDSRGRLALRRGQHALALRHLEAALRGYEAQAVPQRQALARAQLADAYLATQLLPEAVALYQRAVEECERCEAPVEQAWALAQGALAFARMGQAEAAMRWLKRARGLFVQLGNAVGAALLDSHRATLELHAGRPAQALEFARAAAAALAGSGLHSAWFEARALAAEAHAGLGELDAARQEFESLQRDAGGWTEVAARCHAGLGLILLRQGQHPAARSQLERAVEMIEAQRAALPDDEFRMSYGADKQAAYQGLLELALRADEAEPAAMTLLVQMEKARAASLRLGLGLDDTPGAGAWVGEPDRGRWREPLRWLQQQAHVALAAGDAARAAALQARSRELEAQALEAHRRDRAASAPVPEGAPDVPRTDFEPSQLHAALGERAALVAYAFVGPVLAAVVVRGHRVWRFELAAEGLAGRIEQLRFQINALRFGGQALRAHGAQMLERTRVHLQALHRVLWAPLACVLDGAAQVVVIPQRELHYVPWAALDDGRQAVLDRHAVSLAPSARIWLQLERQRLAARERTGRWQPLVVGIGGATLPHVAAEVEAVANAFERPCVLQDGAATLDALRRACAAWSEGRGRRLLHLACHGQFRADSPYFSAIELADGALTLRDATTLPLRGALVALSACESGQSRVAPGDELLGLVRGFLLAQACTVLATLWTVDDAGTAALMDSFYRSLRQGSSSAAALQAAQLALRERLPHPYYWAPYVLHGSSG